MIECHFTAALDMKFPKNSRVEPCCRHKNICTFLFIFTLQFWFYSHQCKWKPRQWSPLDFACVLEQPHNLVSLMQRIKVGHPFSPPSCSLSSIKQKEQFMHIFSWHHCHQIPSNYDPSVPPLERLPENSNNGNKAIMEMMQKKRNPPKVENGLTISQLSFPWCCLFSYYVFKANFPQTPHNWLHRHK